MRAGYVIPADAIRTALGELIVEAVTRLPRDVEVGLRRALEGEVDPLARLHLETILANAALAQERGTWTCHDTGYPMFYLRAGEGIDIEDGYGKLESLCREAVADATRGGRLRPDMRHPLTGHNSGDNCGSFMPVVNLSFDGRVDGLEATFIAKGAGAENNGSYLGVVPASQTKAAVSRFVLEKVAEGALAGRSCPPNIVGVGLGGTSDLAMRLAKEASVLRPVGSRHPEREIAAWEEELLSAIQTLGIGPFGGGGSTTALDVHIDVAMSHSGQVLVAVAMQCCVSKRATVLLDSQGRREFLPAPTWRR